MKKFVLSQFESLNRYFSYKFTQNIGPDFLCIGAQKGGTGWLYDQLVCHPDFWMPPFKELHYFDTPLKLAKRVKPQKNKLKRVNRWPMEKQDKQFFAMVRDIGCRENIDLDRYAALFKFKSNLLSGDITPAYSILLEDVIAQIVKRFPSLKILFIVRDPIDRLW